ncbi:MAG: type II secretion system protein [Zetaproteobacteria bacterium]|nr:type II secretion system protein [Zetaproteobacteria bacterium]
MCNKKTFGFTLIEILVTLVIVSVGMLALGTFFASSIRTEGIAQERIAAVHMAEQLIESWQNTNTPPTPDCSVAGVQAGILVVGTTLANCRANNGVPVVFSLLLSQTAATAPLPSSHPSYAAGVVIAGLPTTVKVGTMLQGLDIYGTVINGSLAVDVRTASVSWQHSGKSYNVYLTHITRY